jgi:hypothetical protein
LAVGLYLPPALTEPLSWVGLIWPEADEDLLYQAGQRWIACSSQLKLINQRADQAATAVWASNDGDAAQAFQAYWSGDKGPPQRLTDDATAAAIIGTALIVFAAAVLALKLAFIVQLAILAAQVALAVATGVAAGLIAATRAACLLLITKAVTHVQTVIRDLLTKARNLLTLTPRQAIRELRFGVTELGRPTQTGAQLEQMLKELAAHESPRLAGLKKTWRGSTTPGGTGPTRDHLATAQTARPPTSCAGAVSTRRPSPYHAAVSCRR